MGNSQGMQIADWIAVVAILAAPLAAVWAQRRIDHARERRGAKLKIFQTLMATRAARVSLEHVQALNSIDIEFYGRRVFGRFRWPSAKERTVLDLWRQYLDHLNLTTNDDEATRLWNIRGDELFTDLLFAMSRAVGYDFDRVYLKRSIYRPQAHGWAELDHRAIRAGLAKLLSGQEPLRVSVSEAPVATAAPVALPAAPALPVPQLPSGPPTSPPT